MIGNAQSDIRVRCRSAGLGQRELLAHVVDPGGRIQEFKEMDLGLTLKAFGPLVRRMEPSEQVVRPGGGGEVKLNC